ncbi:hypothetical protein BJY01DRAFT_257058 [Aspergillus pseudoustus]|uniref:FAD/NAD(P)-binding domain-containing protein n=1 Tax=Aspergillus pseudoustus TaxID=1810923 RepID=A0ABR4KST8_9EURO
MPSKPISIVVIGGSHAGLGVSHRLLRRISPTSEATPIRLTLINPSNEYYFNIAAPRFLVKPGSLSSNQYLYPIAHSFQGYPDGSFNFVRGLVRRIDKNDKVVQVERLGKKEQKGQGEEDITSVDEETISYSYDYLVIASGSTTPATLGLTGLKIPFKADGLEDTRSGIENASKELAAAKSVVIGGGGPLGVELAGELAEAAGPKKRINLVSRSEALLTSPGMGAMEDVRVGNKAESLLRAKGVEVLKSAMVEKVTQDPETKKWIVELMPTGQRIEADAYVDTTGTIPNNVFIPKSYLNDDGWVNVDAHFRVVDGETSRSDTYAVGDITCHPYRLLSRISGQAEAVVSNIEASIGGQKRLVTYSAEAQRKMLVVPVGQSTGAGHFGGWPLIGCLVWYFKGRDFLAYKALKFLMGEAH